jgi:hypothetical protein
MNGAAEINQTHLSLIDQPIADWTPGAALWLIWEMADPAGKSQGLAIDNLRFSASDQAMTPTAPALGAQISGSDLVLTWFSLPAITYQIEYTDNLTNNNWLPLGNSISGTGTALSFTNLVSLSGQRFFRLAILP